MPKYSFYCKQCKNHFTVQSSWKEKDLARCPQCGSTDKVQDFSSIGVIKGSGSRCSAAREGICPSGGFS